MNKQNPPLLQKIIRLYTNLAIFLLNTVFFVVILEVGLGFSLFIYRNIKSTINLSPLDETGKRLAESQKMVRPDKASVVSEKIFYETQLANKYRYVPWVQFGQEDFEGEFVNIRNGIRKSIPNKIQENGKKIYFFGGSTTFGFNVADDETIPSYFAKIAQNKQIAVEVTNWGCPYYFSKQEMFLFFDRLSQKDVPDKVIFLDGLNDLIQSQPSYFGYPQWTKYLEKQFGQENEGKNWIFSLFEKSNTAIIVRKILPKLLKTEQSWLKDGTPYNNPEGVSEAEINQKILSQYLQNVRLIRQLCEKNGIEAYFFIQPVPFYNYPNLSQDPIAIQTPNPRFEQLYPMLRDTAVLHKDMIFLGDMLATEKGLPFVDYFHYSPKFQEKIAQEMFDTVFEQK